MTPQPPGLAELLSAGGTPTNRVAPRPVSEGVSFEEMLELARAGAVRSGIPVTVSSSVDLPLSDQQLARLSSAADRAEAAGLSRVAVAMDEQMLVLDVASRTVVDVVDLASSDPIGGIDGIMSVGDSEQPAPGIGGRAPISSPSLLGALAQRLTG
jgi:hypothetical protein